MIDLKLLSKVFVVEFNLSKIRSPSLFNKYIMKRFLFLLTIIFISTSPFAQTTWKVDPMHSRLGFGITHLGISTVDGAFTRFTATIKSEKSDFSDAVIELSAEASSINTGITMRDDHLKSADFFDVAKFPTITFKSDGIKMISKDKYHLTGNLTIHGVTKPVTVEMWYRGTITNNTPQSKAIIAGFQIKGTLKRSDFGIGPTFPSTMLSEEVMIKADGEFIKN